jgi:hypothetical protein
MAVIGQVADLVNRDHVRPQMGAEPALRGARGLLTGQVENQIAEVTKRAEWPARIGRSMDLGRSIPVEFSHRLEAIEPRVAQPASTR